MKILLASGSPRRQSLLNSFGFDVAVTVPDFDESQVKSESPEQLVTALASGKLESVVRGDALTLAADTVVVQGNKVLGKPKDEAEAFSMLRALSGNEHYVYTGVCIALGGKVSCFYEKSTVTFHKLSDKQITDYIATGSPMDKAGAYGIQDDVAISFIKYVEGEISNVIGLPMGRVISEIERITK